jgi:hypothetical protein
LGAVAAAPLRACLDLSDFSCASKASLETTLGVSFFLVKRHGHGLNKNERSIIHRDRQDDIGTGGYLAGPLCNGRPFGLSATGFFL